jgi:hypothetical protein
MKSTVNSPGNSDGVKPKRAVIFSREPANWETVPADAIRDCIVQISSIGGAVRFGYSRDGGAYSIGVYGLDTKPFTDYLRPGDDVPAYLDTLADEARRSTPAPK